MSKPWNKLLNLVDAGLVPPALLSLWEKNAGSICPNILDAARRQSRADSWNNVLRFAAGSLFLSITIAYILPRGLAQEIFGYISLVLIAVVLLGWAMTTTNSGGIMRPDYQRAIGEFYGILNSIEMDSKSTLFKLAPCSEEDFRSLATGILTTTAAELIDSDNNSLSLGVLEKISVLSLYRARFDQQYKYFKRLGLVKKVGGWKPYFDAAGMLSERSV